MSPAIVWFRRDLRVADNTALNRAADSGRPVLAVYVISDSDTGGARRWWLHHSLLALHADLEAMGGTLLVLAGDPADVLAGLAGRTGASVVYCQKLFEPGDDALLSRLRQALPGDCRLNANNDRLLTEPGAVLTGSGTPFKVFTPFYRAAASVPVEPPETRQPGEFYQHDIDSDREGLDGLLPTPDWASEFPVTWTPGEAGAADRLAAATKSASAYGENRDRPDIEGTTRLSPHLYFGEISPRMVLHALRPIKDAEPLVRQLYWREFSYHLLVENPDMPSSPLRTEFTHFPWVEDDELLRCWQRGRTGYPIVDAGMRQLWRTGWMHNRVRMVVASFLVKHLLIPWQDGADWFLDTLVDADLANNSAGWQWVAGCGTDASPYFRIFNPITQGKKFDPEGDYVRRYVPELSRLPRKFIHEPWTASREELARFGVELGKDYPQPVVEHKEARQRALDAYQLSRDLLKSDA